MFAFIVPLHRTIRAFTINVDCSPLVVISMTNKQILTNLENINLFQIVIPTLDRNLARIIIAPRQDTPSLSITCFMRGDFLSRGISFISVIHSFLFHCIHSIISWFFLSCGKFNPPLLCMMRFPPPPHFA